MKWLLAATFLLAALGTPGAAQMRGMRSSVPARSFARSSMGFARPSGARPAFDSRLVFRPSVPIRSSRGSIFSSRGSTSFGFGNRRAFFVGHSRPFFPRHYRIFISTFPFGSPFFGGSYFDPYLWGYSSFDGASDPTAYQQPSGNYDYDRLNDQVSQLNSQVEMLRDENDSLRSEIERRPQPGREERSSLPEPATVLIFRDGHRTETQNYAIVGQTLWLLTGNRATKVPLSDLDLNKTIKINEDRGVTFLAGKPES